MACQKEIAVRLIVEVESQSPVGAGTVGRDPVVALSPVGAVEIEFDIGQGLARETLECRDLPTALDRPADEHEIGQDEVEGRPVVPLGFEVLPGRGDDQVGALDVEGRHDVGLMIPVVDGRRQVDRPGRRRRPILDEPRNLPVTRQQVVVLARADQLFQIHRVRPEEHAADVAVSDPDRTPSGPVGRHGGHRIGRRLD